jgi:hypothetical protein
MIQQTSRETVLFTAIEKMQAEKKELLESLETLICVVGLTAIKHPTQLSALQDAVEHARAAIARATGELK